MSKTIRNLILFLIIGGVLAVGFYYFFEQGGGKPVENLISTGDTSAGNANPTVNQSAYQGIQLDTTIFSNPAYLSLRDSSVVLVPLGEPGRPNPFAPIGEDYPIFQSPSSIFEPEINTTPDSTTSAPVTDATKSSSSTLGNINTTEVVKGNLQAESGTNTKLPAKTLKKTN